MQTNRINSKDLKISLIVPIKDESDSLETLIVSINRQTFKPAEIILVDGGSTDDTIEIAEKLINGDDRFTLIKLPEASPGKGRNIGVENARFQWIAFTDAGIRLDKNWLEKLVDKIKNNAEIDVIYGNFSPVVDNLFEKCAMFAYVSPQKKVGIRSKFIASSLIKKEVWEAVGGFPDLRAAEDLIFMEAVESHKYKTDFSPKAMVYWKLRPNLVSTFQKFVSYSKHNARAGRAWDWHYGIAKQYLLVVPFIGLSIIHSRWWLLGIGLWLTTRTVRRIFSHRHEFGLSSIFNPVIFLGVALVVITIDMATFIGWAQTLFKKKD